MDEISELEAVAKAANIQIFACAGRDRLMTMLRAGDPAAFDLVNRALPANLDRALCIPMRNEALRKLASTVFMLTDCGSVDAAAKLMESIIAAVDREKSLRLLSVLDHLQPEELAQLDAAIREVLVWSPPRRDGRRSLGARQIFSILKK
jgi:hypothetical protein